MKVRETLPLLPDVYANRIHASNAVKDAEVLLFSRWQSMASVCMYVSIVGTTYAYGVYSELLKTNLGFSQNGLDIIASVGNTGLYLSLIAGLLLENFGLKFVVMGGGFLIFIGFLYIYLAVKGVIAANIVSVSIFFFLSQFGVCCHVSSAITYCIRLFPFHKRGAAVGLGKGYFGLSSAVLGDVAGGYFYKYTSSFILFIAIIIPIFSIVGSSTANLLPTKLMPFTFEAKNGISTSLKPFFIHWFVLFVLLFLVAFCQYVLEVSNFINITLTTILIMWVASIQYLPSLFGDRLIEYSDVDDANSTRSDQCATDSTADSHDYVTFSKQIKSDHFISHNDADDHSSVMSLELSNDCYFGDPIPLNKAIFQWRYWSLYFIYFVMCGTGLMVIDNINAIAEAVGKYPSSFFVSIVALANGAGRVFTGVISDKLADYGVTKLQIFSIACFTMATTQFIFSIGSSFLMYPCLIVTGFLFGSSVSLMAVNVADIFGSRYVATNFGMIDSAPIFGSYFFVTFIVAEFYYTNTVDDGGGDSCVGASCFRKPFLVNSCFCVAATIISFMVDYYTQITTNKSSQNVFE